MPLSGQLRRAFRLAGNGGGDRVGGCGRGDGEGERDEELTALPIRWGRVRGRGLAARVIRVREERGDLIGAPYPERHRGENLLELDPIVGREQTERTPFTR